MKINVDKYEKIIKELRKLFPHGHPDFTTMTLDELALHSDKNHDYARGSDPLGNFNRVACICRQYPGLNPGKPEVVAALYMLKQLDATLWMLSQGFEGDVENTDTRLTDVHVYAKIMRLILRR